LFKIIRVSGPNSLKSLVLLEEKDQVYKEKILNSEEFNKNQLLERFQIKERYAHFRKFHEILKHDKESFMKKSIIDQGLIVYFPEGKSFTGEDIIEFHIHGSKAVQMKFIMELSKIKQFRMAKQVIFYEENTSFIGRIRGNLLKEHFLMGKWTLCK